MDLALRGLELKTLDPYMAGWRLRVVPSLGHLPVWMITNGAVDRTVYRWIADELSRSTVKNTIAVLVHVMEQAVRDGLIKVNPARVSGWQRQYQQVEDELNDPRALALPDWETLQALAKALVARSYGQYQGWGDVVTPPHPQQPASARYPESASRTSTPTTGSGPYDGRPPPPKAGSSTRQQRESAPARYPSSKKYGRWSPSGCWPSAMTPMPGSSSDRVAVASPAVLRDATHWDDVVAELGFEHLRRHDLRHTGLTWFADAGVPLNVLRKIAGHGSLTTTQRYLHPDAGQITAAGAALSAHLMVLRAPRSLPLTAMTAV
ncbi:tyrosine-type recombinase/integrase [Streptomyces sp. NPDC090045]|uniref:tyrosine-type recombinase/integrase n=1 Tax=Streptomyces sp. NPDC090045 TaxID=3365927 RepID=UPI0037F5F80E